MLENKLEELKQLGNYAIRVIFGENIGADDLNVSLNKRNIKITAIPIGYLGGVIILWHGNLKLLKNYSFKTIPTIINNPPEPKEYKEYGYYIYGITENVNDYITKIKAIYN